MTAADKGRQCGLKATGGKREVRLRAIGVDIGKMEMSVAFRILGLPRLAFDRYFAMNSAELAENSACRVTADADRGFPCRVSLEDACEGEELILLNYVSHDVTNPFRTAYAIYVREQARDRAPWVDALPPVFDGRMLSLRGFDQQGMLCDARLAQSGEAEAGIRALFENPLIACIHAHNAIPGCFAARIERHGKVHRADGNSDFQ